MIRRDKHDEVREARFNSIIQDYLKESIRVKQDLAEKMQRMTDVLEILENKLDRKILAKIRKDRAENK